MIQYYDHPWQMPCPAPLPPVPAADHAASPNENEPAAAPSLVPEGQPSPPPLGFPGAEYEWMILL